MMNKQSNIFYDREIKDLEALIQANNYSSVALLSDDHCMEKVWPLFRKHSTLPIDALYQFKAGEEHKSLNTISTLAQQMLTRHDRHTLLINLGGGVVCDMGGFLASIFKRGIDFVHVPTSLLAMVDAAVGGKTGVNVAQHKNMLGLFNSPLALYINRQYLHTLPQREWLSGFAEMLKISLVKDAAFYRELTSLTSVDALSIKHIHRAIALKTAVVDEDYLELGQRRLLNFGHTAGHALESLSLRRGGPALSHGHAVAVGMVLALLLSARKGFIAATVAREIIHSLLRYYPLYPVDAKDVPSLLTLMASDKKNDGGRFRFTLLSNIGQGLVNQQVSDDEVRDAFKEYRLLKP